jgi:hypothetical protein
LFYEDGDEFDPPRETEIAHLYTLGHLGPSTSAVDSITQAIKEGEFFGEMETTVKGHRWLVEAQNPSLSRSKWLVEGLAPYRGYLMIRLNDSWIEGDPNNTDALETTIIGSGEKIQIFALTKRR